MKVCHERKILGGLLAAGSSERMGKTNKLLCHVGGSTIIRRIATQMIESDLDECFAVIGYQSYDIMKELEGLPIKLIRNKLWSRGQGYSISELVTHIVSYNFDFMVVLGDLPGLRKSHINQIINSHKSLRNSKEAITIPEYKGKKGNPVIWGNAYVTELKQLKGDIGGRKLFNKYREKINSVSLKSSCIINDVDTMEDLKKWSN